MMHQSSMDRTSTNGETVFSRTAEHYQSQELLKDILYQNISEIREEKTCQVITNGQTLRTLLKRIQEKRREGEDEKEEEVSNSLHLEALHVQRVYNQIAPHIQDLKQRTWPRVKEFLKALKPGSLVADIGCGNGRYLHINPTIFKIGSDICLPFVHSASARGFEVLSADNLLLPFRDNFFDAAISIGVIHHFASQERRIQALRELVRIMSSGGLMMVYVWAFEQKYRKFDSQDILVPWHKPQKSESSCRRSRLSSLPDTDHLSTSSTGSSVSDEEFTACVCYWQNLNTDSYKTHLLTPVTCPAAFSGSNHQGCLNGQSAQEHSDEGSCTNSTKEACHNKVVGKNECYSRENHLPKEDLLNLCHSENQLAKGEALIKECQKVECYLSSLSKNSLESLSEKSKSSGSVTNRLCSPSPFEEQSILKKTKKVSPDCWSPSYPDDEVFIGDDPSQQDQTKCVSPAPEHAAIFPAKVSQRKKQLVKYHVDSSLVSDPLQCNLQEVNSNSHTELTLPHSSALLKTSSSTSERKSSSREYVEWKRANQKKPTKTISHHSNPVGECFKLRPEISDGQGTGVDFLSFDDDFCIVDLQTVRALSKPPTFSGCSTYTSGSPRGILNMLKQGFQNFFARKTTKNGTRPAPCFMPCLQQSLPPEHFQIREFPQSSLPSGVILDHSPHSQVNAQLESAESVSVCDTALDSHLPPNVDATANCVLQCQNFHQSHLTYQSPLKGQPNRCALAVTRTLQCSRNCEARRLKPMIASSFTCAESDVPLSSTACPKNDIVNTDLCRFYHVFREGELVSLVTQHVPGVKVVDSFYDHANWCLILEKL